MKTALNYFRDLVEDYSNQGIYKDERVLITKQTRRIDTAKARNVINMCANNYLGLCDNPEIINSAINSYDNWGYGVSSVRFICGTQQIHKTLERKISTFLGMDDTILYSSCFDANGGLFEALLTDADAVISDELNHASIIDGIRLCKARRLRYKNNDMADLERCLKEAADCRIRLIITDGVFSMDGTLANLKAICDLADDYDAIVAVDDSHASGFIGANGRGTPEACGVMGRVDIINSTFGKALGGASGGFTCARKEIVDVLRQKSRPYLFSNTLAPSIAAGALKAIEILESTTEYRYRLARNTEYFRNRIVDVGFDIIESTHPIVAVMLYDERVAARVADRMLELGVYVVGFSYPVVPKGKARIRVQVSAVHTKEDLDFVISCFNKVKNEFRIQTVTGTLTQ